jgi:hypothetical protein
MDNFQAVVVQKLKFLNNPRSLLYLLKDIFGIQASTGFLANQIRLARESK